MHLFVANIDIKSQRILIAVKDTFKTDFTSLYQNVTFTLTAEFITRIKFNMLKFHRVNPPKLRTPLSVYKHVTYP